MYPSRDGRRLPRFRIRTGVVVVVVVVVAAAAVVADAPQ
jgi:hypothetical protein